jgi:hypothetical protein
MSTYNDKTLKSVADAVMKVMAEELKGNQHKIDANKNNKIDAHDFKILRGEKKPPFEGGKEKPETVKDKSGAMHSPMSRAKDLARRVLKKEQVERIDEELPGEMHPEAGKVLKHIKPEHHSTYKPFLKKGVYKADYRDRTDVLSAAKKAGHMNEDTDFDSLVEGWAEMEAAAKEREKAKGTGNFDKRKVSTGTVYTRKAAEQNDDEEDEAPKSRKKPKLGATSNLMSDEEFKKKHGMSRKNYERMKSGVKIGESFSEMLESYRENGLAITSMISEIRDYIEEEPTQDEYNAELETAKEKSQGKGKKAEVSKPAVQAVRQEEHECDHPKDEYCDECEMKEEYDLYEAKEIEGLHIQTPNGEHHVIKGIKDTAENGEKIHGKVMNAAAKKANVHWADMHRAAEKSDHSHDHIDHFDRDNPSFRKVHKVHDSVASYVNHHAKIAAAELKPKPGMWREETEQLDEISLKTKIKAYANRSTGAYEAGDAGDDDQAEKNEKSAEKIRANIEKKHGATAAHHADRAADRDFGGRPMVGGYVKGGDSLKGGLRRVLSKDVTKSGTIPKQTQSAMKSMMKNRDISGPKRKLPEEVEQIDEISKKTLGDYVKKASHDVATKGAIVRQFSNDAEAKRKEHGGTTQAVRELSAKADKVFNKSWKRRENMAKAVDRLTKEETELDERTLSKPEMEKREDYVKGMKKKLSGFKSRYGDRAKEVMYATATKMAKGDKE